MEADSQIIVEAFRTPFSAAVVLDVAILTMMAVVGLSMINMRRLFGVAMLSGIYSLLSAVFFVAMDAVDVAFTEAAVGAGVSTVLVLSGMALTSRREAQVSKQRVFMPLAVVVVVGAALIYATIDMPAFGDPNSPANAYVGYQYIVQSPKDIDMPNLVTGILASYRGYDTMGETVVVFTAGIACLLLIGGGSLRGGRKVSDPDERALVALHGTAKALPTSDALLASQASSQAQQTSSEDRD